MAAELTTEFSVKLLQWFDKHGRHDLPWQQNINAYRVWVSEIMLQQTQVATVIPYYEKFMQRFPTVLDLAKAQQEEVLSHWAGLGYYARGRNLHKAAQVIVVEHSGLFPQTFDEVVALPGIGRSTAGAILSIALGQRYAILDGNVKRVLGRYFAVAAWPGEKKTELAMWQQADELTPELRFNDYTQAIMDLGATLCTRSKPKCQFCPVQKGCQAFELNRVSEFPVKKPKKHKPIRQAWLLLTENSVGQICLQQRPQKGIWGGLWSLPEYESLQACEESLQSQGLRLQSLVKWESFRHTFSHYHLDIHPLYFKQELKKSEETAEKYQTTTTKEQWLAEQDIVEGHYGMPAPISKLIEQWRLHKTGYGETL